MNCPEIEKFKAEFQTIIGLRKQLSDNAELLKKLHAWDKNNSHRESIAKHLIKRDELKNRIVVMLDGRSYDDWKKASKKLSSLKSRLKRAEQAKIKIELEILHIIF